MTVKLAIFHSTGVEVGDLSLLSNVPASGSIGTLGASPWEGRYLCRYGPWQVAYAIGMGETKSKKVIDLPTLILAPLAVAAQTVIEGAAIGVKIKHCYDQSDVVAGINITNYDRLHKFDPTKFGAIVLDESSIIKHHDTQTLKALLEGFGQTQYKLCATATPAPNDWTELGTHAEF